MDRIQPPPNYYGAPYPQPNDNVPPNQPYPPQMNNYNNPPFNPNVRQEMKVDNNVEEFYESFNKLVSTNLGRNVIVHCSFTDSTKWHDKEFVGVLASAGDNYIIVYNAQENIHYLIVGVYIDFIEFTEKITIDGVTSK